MPRRVTIFVLFTIIAALCACEREEKSVTKKEPWVFESEKAPYSLQLGGEWEKEDPAVLNEFADLAVTHSDDLFFIVIPQMLPSIEGADRPDALDLKRAGVSLMEEQIGDLEIQKQGPVRVNERQGQSVVARGVVDDQQVKYLTIYLTEGDWGFQLVGWSPIEKRRALLVRVDELLTGWNFESPEKPEPDDGIQTADAGDSDAGAP